jgi:hypothetical protein
MLSHEKGYAFVAHVIGTLSRKRISSPVTVFWRLDLDGDLSLSR